MTALFSVTKSQKIPPKQLKSASERILTADIEFVFRVV